MKKVFYSPGPTCGCDTYEVVDFGGPVTQKYLDDYGYEKAVQHYEGYGDYDEDESGVEPEYDYCWYDMDDPEVEGRI